jgi:hypothetical protein
MALMCVNAEYSLNVEYLTKKCDVTEVRIAENGSFSDAIVIEYVPHSIGDQLVEDDKAEKDDEKICRLFHRPCHLFELDTVTPKFIDFYKQYFDIDISKYRRKED